MSMKLVRKSWGGVLAALLALAVATPVGSAGSVNVGVGVSGNAQGSAGSGGSKSQADGSVGIDVEVGNKGGQSFDNKEPSEEDGNLSNGEVKVGLSLAGSFYGKSGGHVELEKDIARLEAEIRSMRDLAAKTAATLSTEVAAKIRLAYLNAVEEGKEATLKLQQISRVTVMAAIRSAAQADLSVDQTAELAAEAQGAVAIGVRADFVEKLVAEALARGVAAGKIEAVLNLIAELRASGKFQDIASEGSETVGQTKAQLGAKVRLTAQQIHEIVLELVQEMKQKTETQIRADLEARAKAGGNLSTSAKK